MRRAILVIILLLLVGASTATVTILARRSQSDALASARGRQETLAKLTTANVELGLKTGDIKAIQEFLKSLQSDSAFAGGFLLDSRRRRDSLRAFGLRTERRNASAHALPGHSAGRRPGLPGC